MLAHGMARIVGLRGAAPKQATSVTKKTRGGPAVMRRAIPTKCGMVLRAMDIGR